MTEIVWKIISWVKTHRKVNTIIASTDKSNIAPFKVLEKSGFIKTGGTEKFFNWKLKVQQTIGNITP
jgi:RimJ/RimL family protein N-acetyltransferase